MDYKSILENSIEHNRALADTGFWGRQAAGCIFLAKSTGRILLSLRSPHVLQPNQWGNWGGAMDEGETPEEAVRREAFEEAGADGDYEYIPLMVYRSGDFRYYNYLVVVDEEFDPGLDWETSDHKWCEFGKWPSPLHFGLQALFADAQSVSIIKREIEEALAK